MPFQLSKWQKRRSAGCCKQRTSVLLWGRSETNESVTLFAPRCVQGTIRFEECFCWAVFSILPRSLVFEPLPTPAPTQLFAAGWALLWYPAVSLIWVRHCGGSKSDQNQGNCIQSSLGKVHHWSWCGAKHCCPSNNNKVIQYYEVPKDFMIRRIWGLRKVENEWLRAKWEFSFKSQISFFSM